MALLKKEKVSESIAWFQNAVHDLQTALLKTEKGNKSNAWFQNAVHD